jgi:hypothetical protein
MTKRTTYFPTYEPSEVCPDPISKVTGAIDTGADMIKMKPPFGRSASCVGNEERGRWRGRKRRTERL